MVQSLSCSQLDDPAYLAQGSDITAYQVLQAPGDLKVFDDPAAEALKYHTPYPEVASVCDNADFSKWFIPYRSGPFRYQFFKALYDKNSLAVVIPSNSYIIPPIIHQIWVGPKSRERYERMRQTWIKNHPGWIYKLWTDEDVKKLKLINQTYYDRTRIYAEKADILRYELLYLFGGIYADIDTESIFPLDILNRCYEFYTGLAENTDAFANNAFIASVPGHPILREVIESIPGRTELGFPFPVNTAGCCLTSAMCTVVPQFPDALVVAFPTTYLNVGMLPNFSGPASPLPHSFMAHGFAYDWRRLVAKIKRFADGLEESDFSSPELVA